MQCGGLCKDGVNNYRYYAVTGTAAWLLDQGELCKNLGPGSIHPAWQRLQLFPQSRGKSTLRQGLLEVT